MTRVAPALAIALMILVGGSTADAAPKREPKRAYKPAERRQSDADAQPSQAAAQEGERLAPVGTYEQELQAAKEKRDQDLADAGAGDADQRTLEKKKQEIFAQYAAIVAALRDKYEAAHADDPATARPPAGKNRPKPKVRSKPTQPDPADAEETPRKKRSDKSRDAAGTLAAAQEDLAEENRRHQSKIDQLNPQLQQAESSGNQREVRRVQKLIEKENNSYNARKVILERRVRELGGSPTAPPPAEPANP